MIKIRSSSCLVLILVMMMNSLILALGHSGKNSLEENSSGQTSSLQRNKRFVMITKSIQPLTFFWPIRKRCCCPPISSAPATMAPTLPPPPAGNVSVSPPPAEGGGGANMTGPLTLEVEIDEKQQNLRSEITTCRCNQRQNRVQQVVSEKTVVKKRIMVSTAADPVFGKAARKLRAQESVRENDPRAVKQSKFKMRMRSSLSRRISSSAVYSSSASSAKSETVTRSLVKTLPIANNRAAASLKMRKRMMVSGTGTTDTPKTRFSPSSFSPHSSRSSSTSSHSSLLSNSVPRKSSKKRSCIMYSGTLMCR